MTENPVDAALSGLVLAEDKVHKSLIPDDVVIRDFLCCVNDDTWVRHAELVNISDLKETPHEEVVKEEVLRTYIEERQRTKGDVPRDMIMEGILWQEKFMEEYKQGNRTKDGTEATNYKRSLLEGFRRKQGGSLLTSGPATQTKAIEYQNISTASSVSAAGVNYEKKACDQIPSVYTPVVQPEQPLAASEGGAELDASTAEELANEELATEELATEELANEELAAEEPAGEELAAEDVRRDQEDTAQDTAVDETADVKDVTVDNATPIDEM